MCLNMICEPITTACGHSFCRVCLVNSLRISHKKCPSCREVCHISAEAAAENNMIKKIAMSIDPVIYAQRLAESESEKQVWTKLYPVFYYNSTIFPGSHLNLHLFEPRYKIMMQRVVNSTRCFAYVPNFTNYSASIGDIALVAELKECEFMANGNVLLDAVMTKRHKITHHFVEEGTRGLSFVNLEPYEDIKIEDPTELQALNRLQVDANVVIEEFLNLAAVRRHVEDQHGTAPTHCVERLSLWVIAICAMSEREKYTFLASQNTRVRLEVGIENLRALSQRVQGARQMRSAVQGTVQGVFDTGANAFRAVSELLGGAVPYDDEDDERVEVEQESGTSASLSAISNESNQENEEQEAMRTAESA